MNKFLFEFNQDELRLLCASTNIVAYLQYSKNKDESQKLTNLYNKLQKVYDSVLK